MNCLSSGLSSQTSSFGLERNLTFPCMAGKAVSYHTNTQVLGTISTEIVAESQDGIEVSNIE